MRNALLLPFAHTPRAVCTAKNPSFLFRRAPDKQHAPRSLCSALSALLLRFRRLGRDGTPVHTMPAPRKPTASFSGQCVLVAEDHPLNRRILEKLLTDANLTPDLVEDGAPCVERFAHAEAGKYACILLDIQMPTMDGYEVTHAIRALAHPDAARIPIIAMTANVFAEDVQKSLDAGMNDHLCKPVDVNQLYSVLEKYISVKE